MRKRGYSSKYIILLKRTNLQRLRGDPVWGGTGPRSSFTKQHPQVGSWSITDEGRA